VGVGDIAYDGKDDEKTAKVVDGVIAENPDAVVFTLGDNAYPNGSADDYKSFYEPTWGRFKSRTHPIPGNHEYQTPNASAYFEYFGSAAGEMGKGYYSYDLGAWHIVALNSEIDMRPSSRQTTWLKKDLAATKKDCILAYWHRPRFSSGPYGDAKDTAPLWKLLYAAGAEVVLSGHEHYYERFAPLDGDGKPDEVSGIREFIIGTGGVSLYDFKEIHASSEVRDNHSYGVMKFVLHDHGYQWDFIPAEGSPLHDQGRGECRPARRR
jgi:hypothetical protein